MSPVACTLTFIKRIIAKADCQLSATHGFFFAFIALNLLTLNFHCYNRVTHAYIHTYIHIHTLIYAAYLQHTLDCKHIMRSTQMGCRKKKVRFEEKSENLKLSISSIELNTLLVVTAQFPMHK